MAEAADYTARAKEIAEEKTNADVTPVSRLALRDGGIALAALSLWAASDAWHTATGLGAAALLSVLDGLAAGYVINLLAHEWGHFAGARWFGGIAPTTPRITRLCPIFRLDLQRSPVRAFQAMSVGGNLAHWAAVVLLFTWVPIDSPGRAALACGAFAFAFGASVTELPVIRRSFAGASPAESFKGLSRATLRRDRWIGIAAGALLFVSLI